MAPERLLLLREAHELSQRELAAALGVSDVYISLLESGKKRPSARLLDKLATYFRIKEGVLCTPPRHGPCQRCAS